MAAEITENVDHQIGGAIDDLRLLREIRGAVDEATEPDATQEAIEIPVERAFGDGEQVEAAEPRRFLALLERDLLAELPEESPLAIPLADLARDEEKIAAAHERHVVRERRRRLRQLDPEFLQSVLDASRHRRLRHC